MNNISNKSAWNQKQIQEFLEETRIPIRISVVDGKYPFICSVWFECVDSLLVIVCHKNSKLSRNLIQEGRCAFEIANNEPPYLGVRGKADVQVSGNDAKPTLTNLIKRYLGNTNHRLAHWLLGRSEEEIEFTLHPTWITSWDYRQRMERANS